MVYTYADEALSRGEREAARERSRLARRVKSSRRRLYGRTQGGSLEPQSQPATGPAPSTPAPNAKDFKVPMAKWVKSFGRSKVVHRLDDTRMAMPSSSWTTLCGWSFARAGHTFGPATHTAPSARRRPSCSLETSRQATLGGGAGRRCRDAQPLRTVSARLQKSVGGWEGTPLGVEFLSPSALEPLIWHIGNACCTAGVGKRSAACTPGACACPLCFQMLSLCAGCESCLPFGI